MVEILENALRSMAFFFDNIVYGLIPLIYKLFVYLSEVNLFDSEAGILNQLVNHIYTLLGIFMLFKVSFSLIRYLVDPNSFSDSSKGFGKLITNVLISLILLVSVPMIFDVAMDIQKTIVNSNVIGELILGYSGTTLDENNEIIDNQQKIDEVNSRARDVQFMMFGAFYSIDQSFIGEVGSLFENCKLSDGSKASGVLGAIDMATKGCLEDLENALSDYEYTSAADVTLYDFFKYKEQPESEEVKDQRYFDSFKHLLHWKVNGKYVINYLAVISTFAAGYLVFLLISFSVDIAVRTIKLCFLQMVAPIAIISYIDPEESITKSKLHNWIHECAITYFSLFLRLATVFFVMLLISVISESVLGGIGIPDYIKEEGTYNIWIYLFMIIGAFMFAKQVPKMIESIFGIKGSGDLHLNPFKNEGGAMIIGGVLGAGLSSAASGVSAFNASRANKEKLGTSLLRGLGGATGGTFRGLYDGSKAKGLKDIGKTSMNNAGIAARNASIARGTNVFGRTVARTKNVFGMPSKKEILDRDIEQKESLSNRAKNMDKHMESELAKKSDLWKNLQATKSYYQQLAVEGKISAADLTVFNNKVFAEEKRLKQMYYEAGGITDASGNLIMDQDQFLVQDKKAFEEEAKDIGVDVKNVDDWNEIDKIKKDIELDVYKTRSSDEYRDANRYDQVVKREAGQRHINK